MKFEKEDDGSFRMVMEASDASEAEIALQIESIEFLLEGLKKWGFSRERRERDRGGYYRYSKVEKSLEMIVGHAQTALQQIKFIDFPPRSEPRDPKGVQ